MMTHNRKIGVIGYPVSHSLSPRIHNYWLKQHHINATYEAIEVRPENLEIFLRKMPEEGFIGVNVTIPHKEAVFRLLDTEKVQDMAHRIEAVNTIVVKNGTLTGLNTDAYGFVHSLLEKYSHQELKNISRKTLVIGAGGAARAICAGIENYTEKLILINRTHDRAEKLASHMRALGMRNISVSTWDNAEAVMGDVSLLINTTSLGMKGQPPLAISLGNLPKTAVVADIVYNPLPTQLLQQAATQGNRTIDGLGMLLYQAQGAFKEWFGILPEVTPELRQYVAEGLA